MTRSDVPFSVLAVASAAGIYALNGYGGVVCFGEEIRAAPQAVGRIVYLALAVGAAIVILPLAAVLAAAPDLDALYRAPAPILDFLRQSAGGIFATLVSLSVAGAVFNCMVAVALTFGRMVFAAARDEAWPAPLNRLFVQLSPRFGSPAIATLTLGLFAVPLCLAPIRVLILINGNINIAVYGTLSLAVLAGRRSGATAHSAARAPWHPAAPLVVIAAMAALSVADLLDPETGRPALLATGATVAAGMLYAERVTRRNPQWRHRDAPHAAPIPAGDT